MRVALITEGAYPYRPGPASTWCHQLVAGQPRVAYQVLALTGETDDHPPYPLPPNVETLRAMPVGGRPATPVGRIARLRSRRAATSAAVLLCRGLLGDDPHHSAMFRNALTKLTQLAADGTHPLHGIPLADVLLDAWRAARLRQQMQPSHGPETPDYRVPLPRLSVSDAEAAAVLLEHALRPLSVHIDDADLCHATSAGLPLLVALATRWRTGTPYLLTEHAIYLRERYLDYGRALPEAVKAVMLRFLRALSTLGYAEAALVVAGSRFNQRWQLRHGAHPARVVVVPGGVDPTELPRCRHEPAAPVIVWRGQLDATHDVHTLIRALAQVRGQIPTARLLLIGEPINGWYADSCQDLTAQLGLTDAVELVDPPVRAADAYAAGQVVALPQLSEGTPYQLMEAMMCARATVSTNVGAAGEVVGDTGLLVSPGDPPALATALISLLADPARRRTLAAAAHRRAAGLFRLDQLVRAYDQLYLDVADQHRPAAAEATR